MISSGRHFYSPSTSNPLTPHYKQDVEQLFQDKQSSQNQHTPILNPNRPIRIEPRAGRSQSVLRSTIPSNSGPCAPGMLIRTKQHEYKRTSVFQTRNASYLSQNLWESNRRKTLDRANLGEITSLQPEFQSIKRIEDYSGLVVRSNDATSKFKQKVARQVPKGR